MTRLSKEWIQHNQIAVYAVSVLLSIWVGIGIPSTSSILEPLINPILAALLYVTFLEVPFVRIREAFRNARFMLPALGMNFLVVPAVVFGLTRLLPQEPVLLVGVFMGWQVAEFIEPGPFVEAFVVIIAVPMVLAWVTQSWAARSPRGAAWQDAMEWLPVPMMGITLFVVVASQLPRVQGAIGRIPAVVPVYVAFLIVMPLLARLVAGYVGMDVGASRALVFTSVTRNSLVILPLALALPAGYALAPAVVVTQTLVELSGMVVLTRVVPNWLVPDTPARFFGLDAARPD